MGCRHLRAMTDVYDSAFLAVAFLSSAFDFKLPVLSSVGGCRCPLYNVGEYKTACRAR